jgi:hypothetical protein
MNHCHVEPLLCLLANSRADSLPDKAKINDKRFEVKSTMKIKTTASEDSGYAAGARG